MAVGAVAAVFADWALPGVPSLLLLFPDAVPGEGISVGETVLTPVMEGMRSGMKSGTNSYFFIVVSNCTYNHLDTNASIDPLPNTYSTNARINPLPNTN